MNISARNFRRLVKADIAVERIALVAGGNAQAKTSLLQAIAEAMTNEPISQFDLPKKDAVLLVHDGAANAHIEITTEHGSVEFEWPECKRGAFGNKPPQASPIALGMISIPTIAAKDRAAALEPYLHIAPTREDLASALSEGYEPATIDRVWQQIQRDGWNAVHTRQVQESQKTRGAWEQVTGESFGSVKIKSWKPKNWRPGLDSTTDDELEQRLAAAKKVYAETLQANAVNAAETERQRKLVASLPQLQQELEGRGIARDQAGIRYENALRVRQKLPRLSRDDGVLTCPHCGKYVVEQHDLTVKTLKKFEPIPDAKLKAASEAIDVAERAMSHDQDLLTAARAAYTLAEQAVTDALQAKAALETATPAAAALTPTISVEIAQSHIQNASDDLLMARQYTKADDLAATWEDLQEFITLLAPTGLRQTKLVEALGAFNREKLAPLAEKAGWEPVKIEDDFSVTYGGRRWSLLGANTATGRISSVQFRVLTILQLAMALEDGSDLVLIDGADILDTAGRDELFALLETYDERGPPVIVAMTLFDPARTPDLAKLDLGATFWIEDGIVWPLAEVVAREEAA